tara:strand:- start:78 stop:281 length:204 start_codon:yes stop_codon:yes gene_type:complete
MPVVVEVVAVTVDQMDLLDQVVEQLETMDQLLLTQMQIKVEDLEEVILTVEVVDQVLLLLGHLVLQH